jgi:hypothetical protein
VQLREAVGLLELARELHQTLIGARQLLLERARTLGELRRRRLCLHRSALARRFAQRVERRFAVGEAQPQLCELAAREPQLLAGRRDRLDRHLRFVQAQAEPVALAPQTAHLRLQHGGPRALLFELRCELIALRRERRRDLAASAAFRRTLVSIVVVRSCPLTWRALASVARRSGLLGRERARLVGELGTQLVEPHLRGLARDLRLQGALNRAFALRLELGHTRVVFDRGRLVLLDAPQLLEQVAGDLLMVLLVLFQRDQLLAELGQALLEVVQLGARALEVALCSIALRFEALQLVAGAGQVGLGVAELALGRFAPLAIVACCRFALRDRTLEVAYARDRVVVVGLGGEQLSFEQPRALGDVLGLAARPALQLELAQQVRLSMQRVARLILGAPQLFDQPGLRAFTRFGRRRERHLDPQPRLAGEPSLAGEA